MTACTGIAELNPCCPLSTRTFFAITSSLVTTRTHRRLALHSAPQKMLALRLSGARSIRAQPSGQPCCAHVTRAGVNGRSRPTCVTTIGQRRNYANSDSKNDAPAPSNNPGPDAKNKAATDPSKKGPRPDLDAMVLIRNALTLLRRFKENPKEFGQGAEQNYDLRQNRIFTGTLKVLKDALQVHAAATTKLGQGAQDLNAAGTLKDAYDVVQSLAPKEVKDSPKAPIKSAKSTKSVGAAPKADKAQVQPVKTPEKKAASVKQKPTSPAKQPTKQIPAETSVAKSMKKVGATAKVRMEEAQSNKTESKATDGANQKHRRVNRSKHWRDNRKIHRLKRIRKRHLTQSLKL